VPVDVGEGEGDVVCGVGVVVMVPVGEGAADDEEPGRFGGFGIPKPGYTRGPGIRYVEIVFAFEA
jgi:hypothetical protein